MPVHLVCLYPLMPWLLVAEMNAAYWRTLFQRQDEDAEVVPFRRRRGQGGGYGFAKITGELIDLASYRDRRP